MAVKHPKQEVMEHAAHVLEFQGAVPRDIAVALGIESSAATALLMGLAIDAEIVEAKWREAEAFLAEER